MMIVSRLIVVTLWVGLSTATLHSSDSSDRQAVEESLGLDSSFGLQLVSEGTGLIDPQGCSYSWIDATPHIDLFSSDSFHFSNDGKRAVHRRTGESFPVSVFRAQYPDGTTLQLVRDESGEIQYAELHRPPHHSSEAESVFFVRPSHDMIKSNESGTPMLSFAKRHLKQVPFQYQFGEVKAKKRPNPAVRDRAYLPPGFNYTRGDGSSKECKVFRVVDLAVLYDAEFCAFYQSTDAARSRIQGIVAAASLRYENDMCVKLRLDAILAADSSCQGPSKTIGRLTRIPVCADVKPHLLYDFSKWMEPKRDTLGIRNSSLIHLMTGYALSDDLGCGYLGTLCWKKWSYGVEYMTFRKQSIASQAIVLAHEIGVRQKLPSLCT